VRADDKWISFTSPGKTTINVVQRVLSHVFKTDLRKVRLYKAGPFLLVERRAGYLLYFNGQVHDSIRLASEPVENALYRGPLC
jgi:hypothetical protein